ncbi:MAG: hypothetical protein HON76_20085 [Candidatus Scalindua sp.]|nr:hypothetical protein [Candidatus Scalindua sp.]
MQTMCVPYSKIEMDDVPLPAHYPFLDTSYACARVIAVGHGSEDISFAVK